MVKYIIYFLSIIFLIFLGINFLILDYSKNIFDLENLKESQVALVLGAGVHNKYISDIFKDRIDSAIELYEEGKVKKILISGDHGSKSYDEVNIAKSYLLGKNVKEEDIFLDHAGFDTYDSVYRAKEVFEVTDCIIISQKFHLARALYIAYSLNLNTQGFSADLHNYIGFERNNIREFLARIKAFFNVSLKSYPKFLGPKIDIYGDGRQTWD
jgi:SanA protein